MSAPQPQNSHPRRRPFKGNASPLSTHGMQLRKSGTFSSPKSLSNDICGLKVAILVIMHIPLVFCMQVEPGVLKENDTGKAALCNSPTFSAAGYIALERKGKADSRSRRRAILYGDLRAVGLRVRIVRDVSSSQF